MESFKRIQKFRRMEKFMRMEKVQEVGEIPGERRNDGRFKDDEK